MSFPSVSVRHTTVDPAMLFSYVPANSATSGICTNSDSSRLRRTPPSDRAVACSRTMRARSAIAASASSPRAMETTMQCCSTSSPWASEADETAHPARRKLLLSMNSPIGEYDGAPVLAAVLSCKLRSRVSPAWTHAAPTTTQRAPSSKLSTMYFSSIPPVCSKTGKSLKSTVSPAASTRGSQITLRRCISARAPRTSSARALGATERSASRAALYRSMVEASAAASVKTRGTSVFAIK